MQFTISNIQNPKSKNSGEVNILSLMVVFLGFATAILGGLAIYYITQFNRTQATINQQIESAVSEAKEEQKASDEAEFDERLKDPFRTYRAPSVFGQIAIKFPKNWNLYADINPSRTIQMNLFFHPDHVRSEASGDPYAMRISLEDKLYTRTIDQQQERIRRGEVTAGPIRVSGIRGTRYSGDLGGNKSGVMVILPLRDKTLSLWSESQEYIADFNRVITQLNISP